MVTLYIKQKIVSFPIAMTGCPGIEDVDFTILSDDPETSGLFRWTKDGKVEETKPEVTNMYHMDTTSQIIPKF